MLKNFTAKIYISTFVKQYIGRGIIGSSQKLVRDCFPEEKTRQGILNGQRPLFVIRFPVSGFYIGTFFSSIIFVKETIYVGLLTRKFRRENTLKQPKEVVMLGIKLRVIDAFEETPRFRSGCHLHVKRRSGEIVSGRIFRGSSVFVYLFSLSLLERDIYLLCNARWCALSSPSAIS